MVKGIRRQGPRRLLGAALLVVLVTTAPATVWAGGGASDGTVDVAAMRLAALPTGAGVTHATASGDDSSGPAATLAPDYDEVEYLFSGVANTYSGRSTGPVEVASTGNDFVTRVIARFPKDPADFSGRVFLEPFNTTAGFDRDVIWRQTAPLLQANGDAWVGVTVRATSVGRLQEFDAARYADLSIPLNDFNWDMVRQLGAKLRQGGKQSPLGELEAEHLYTGGYSQSGVDTATLAMAFHDRTRMPDGGPVFDGYFPAAHSATLTKLQNGSGVIGTFETGPMQPVDVPVVDFETQNDAQGWTTEIIPGAIYTSQSGASVRRDDASSAKDKYRLFEIAGAPHSSGGTRACDGTPSSFPVSPFVRAAAAQLFRWAEKGTVPPKVPRIDMETIDLVSVAKADEYGNAMGGVRSPFVDVPLVSFEVQSTPGYCVFSGEETPLPPDVLASRYGDVESYVEEFTDSLDETIDAGFLLKRDRADILEAASEKARTLLPQGG